MDGMEWTMDILNKKVLKMNNIWNINSNSGNCDGDIIKFYVIYWI